jgi:hypothetical protein
LCRVNLCTAAGHFLGYNPLPEANGWGERLVRHRRTLGLSQKEAAKRLGVDPSTLARWERARAGGEFLNRVEFLGDDAGQDSDAAARGVA